MSFSLQQVEKTVLLEYYDLNTSGKHERSLIMDGARNKKSGFIRREEAKRTDSAGAVIFREIGGELYVLMVRSRCGWGFPKGHIEKGETEEAAACREVFEETGIRAELAPGFRCETGSGLRDEPRKIIYFVGTASGGELIPELNEVADAAWQPVNKVEDLLRFENDVPVWREAKRWRTRMDRD